MAPTGCVGAPTLRLSFALLLLLLAAGGRAAAAAAAEETCPCEWRDDNRSWNCGQEGVTSVPVQCWPLHEDVHTITFEHLQMLKSHDLAHENLYQLDRLMLHSPLVIADDALRHLPYLTYLDMTNLNLTRLPDLSAQTRMRSLELGYNQLREAPSFGHMTELAVLSLHHNVLRYLPDGCFPPSSLGMTMIENGGMRELNASSIINASAGSSLTFDYALEFLWATEEEKALLEEKNYYSNVDLLSIVHIIDNPTNP